MSFPFCCFEKQTEEEKAKPILVQQRSASISVAPPSVHSRSDREVADIVVASKHPKVHDIIQAETEMDMIDGKIIKGTKP